MKTYDEFKGIVLDNLMYRMPDEFKSGSIRIIKMPKVNEDIESLVMNLPNQAMSPSINVRILYEEYQKTDIDTTLQMICNSFKKAFSENESISSKLDFEHAKENIVMSLINTEQNKHFLEDKPNREFHDLSIIYRWIVETEQDGVSSIIITNGLAQNLNLTESQLYEFAQENTQRIMPPVIADIMDVMASMMQLPPEVLDEMKDDIAMPSQRQYVISNKFGTNGAVSILNKDVMSELAEKVDSNLFILPSSVHECIAMATNDFNAEELAEMVHSVNSEALGLNERLSNQVYYFDKKVEN